MTELAAFDLLHYAPMRVQDVDAVLALEQSVFAQPWTRNNFCDSLASGYDAWVLHDDAGALAGYFLLMEVVDEAHLLDVAVAPGRQGTGLGRYLLGKVAARARGMGVLSVLLEVRPSNARALDVYRRYGYVEIGRRRAYYPAVQGQREDAIVMRFVL